MTQALLPDSTSFSEVSFASEDHRELLDGEWWRVIPAWRSVPREDFHDHRWQLRNSVRSVPQLSSLLEGLVSRAFLDDLRQGMASAPMTVGLTPHVLSLVDWCEPVDDPIRRQFLPLGSEHEPDHPMTSLDALAECHDAVAPGLVHRYPDKVLFLALDVCPVYCRYCTRSYSVGGSTAEVDKLHFRPKRGRWDDALAYLKASPQVEDVVLSGGDLSMLGAEALEHLLQRLLQLPTLRRVRVATKSLAVLPQKFLSDEAWTGTLLRMADQGREAGKQVCVHTHFNHPREVTELSRQACERLHRAGVIVRNQSVLLRGVNDDEATLLRLVRRLGWVNVHPYYVYVHDLVPGVETLRTSLSTAVELEKRLRGRTAGFLMPTFVCDLAGGGGKRDAHSYEHYDTERGLAVYRSPVAHKTRAYFHFDPLREVAPAVRRGWADVERRQQMLRAAVEEAGLA